MKRERGCESSAATTDHLKAARGFVCPGPRLLLLRVAVDQRPQLTDEVASAGDEGDVRTLEHGLERLKLAEAKQRGLLHEQSRGVRLAAGRSRLLAPAN